MASKKLTKLTDAQTARLPAIRDEWLRHGLSTERADRAAAERGVALAYRAAGLEPPTTVVWLDSPLAGAVVAALLAQVGAQVRDQVWAQVRDQVWGQVKAQVGAQVRDQVWGQVWDQVGAKVRDQVWGQVRDQVWAQVRDQVWGQVRAQVGRACYGSHDASWLSFYAAFSEFGIDTSRLDGLSLCARSCGWFWPFENVVILTDRPTAIRFDDAKRLHCETGPAIAYSDGFGVHAWHGVRIPSEWIEDRASLTPQQALTWKNVEQRRAACEIIGWHRILAELHAVTIDKDGDPEIGELVEVDLPDAGRERFLRVTCGTGREFALPVPPDMPTALAAQAWTWGADAAEWKRPEVRT